MSEPVDYRGYPIKPRKLDEFSWFYEEPKGVVILTERRRLGERAAQVVIPWRKLEAAVDRRRKLKSTP
jgi:hypothetical protein